MIRASHLPASLYDATLARQEAKARRYQYRCKRCNEPHTAEMEEYCSACIEAERGFGP